MYQHSSILTGIVVFLLCLVLACGQPQNGERRPCGIKLYNELCRRTEGASGYGLSVMKLICFNTDIPSNMSRFALSETEGDVMPPMSNLTCSKHSIIFQSRARSIACAAVMSTEDIPKNYEQMKIRLMVAMRFKKVEYKFQVFDLDSSSFSPYQFINIRYVTALVYAPKAKTLMLSMRRPSKIVTSKLDAPGLTTIINRAATALVVDEERHLVFFADYDLYLVGRLTQDGNQLEYFDRIEHCSRLYSLALDPKRERVFLPCSYGLMAVSYQGQNKTILYERGGLGFGLGRSVCFDATTDILYFNLFSNVMKISLSNNVISKVIRLSFDTSGLQCYGTNIYVGALQFPYNKFGIISKLDGGCKVMSLPRKVSGFLFTITY